MSSLSMVHVLHLDIPLAVRSLSDSNGRLGMQAPLAHMNLRGDGLDEGGGFMSESDFSDSENEAFSIFSDISTASGGESDRSDHSEGVQSDLSAASIHESRSAEGSDVNQECNVTPLGSNSVHNASIGNPVVQEDSHPAKNS
mmetsp:Transcript_50379/g.80535  ORF Transcript_50379/g.80535 Transcript_50379/m.80535 type:complete len:142 (+) Transcript_50379:85-510(+)